MLPGRRERENGGRGERGSRNEVVFIRRVFWRESATRDIPNREGRGQRNIARHFVFFFLSNVGFVDRLERERRMKIRTKISRKFKKV